MTKEDRSELLKKAENLANADPKGLIRSLEAAMESGQNVEQWLGGMEGETDLKEKILQEAVRKLFSKEDLHMISRFDDSLAYYVLRHLIVCGFYEDVFMKTQFFILLGPKKSLPGPLILEDGRCLNGKFTDRRNPCYERHIYWVLPRQEELIGSHRRFISELEQLTISFKGQGRSELVALVNSLNERIRQDEIRGNFLTKAMGLAK